MSDAALSGSALRWVAKGSVLMVTRGMILNHTVPIALAERPLTINQDMKALVPRRDLQGDYLMWLLVGLNPAILARVEEAAHGTKALRTEQWRKLPLAVPPIDIQRRIADFLDRKTASIDTLIAKQEQLLALLAEKRQALITQAVTKGLDPNVPMKDSGVDWIGEVPAHWSVAALSTRYQIDLGKMLSPEVANGPYPLPYLGNQHVRWDHVVVDDLPTMSIDPSERERYTLRPGDLLVCEGGEVGRTAMWRGELDVCAYQKALHRLRARNDGDVARYLYFALVTAAGLGVFEAEGNRSTFVHLTSEKLRRHRFPFPPTAEQAKIAEYLDREAGRLDTLSQRVQAMIEKLREYRQALITAAVTGQLDVTPTIHSERRPSPQAEAV